MNTMMDIMDPGQGARSVRSRIHAFYLRELEFWLTTDVDGIIFMDDWGSQDQLLIPPSIWRNLFKPLYKDDDDRAHAKGEFVFRHSDGHISDIYPDLIDVGVDAKAKGRLTFGGEIDRLHVLTDANPGVGRNAVRYIAEHLDDPSGGIIAQFEFGAAAKGETALAIFEEGDRIDRQILATPGVTS